MRLPSVPGPRDVLAAGELLWSMLPRVGALIDEAEALLGRVGGLLDGVERTREAADDVVGRAAETVDGVGDTVAKADETVTRVGDTVAKADETVAQVAETIGRAEATVTRAEQAVVLAADLLATTTGAVDRLVVLLDALEPSLLRLQPTLERLADTTDPREVDALVQLIDHLPVLVTQMERDVMPILTSMGTVAPDLHDLLDLTAELNEMLAKVPGMGRIKKRIDEQQAASHDEPI